MKTQRIYNKVQPTAYTQEKETGLGLAEYLKGGNKAFGVVDSLTHRKAVTDCFHPSIQFVFYLFSSASQ